MSQSNQIKKLELVEQLIKLGFGRRRIAKKLCISEWEARALISAVLPISTPPVSDPKTDIKLDASNVVLSAKSGGATEVKLKQNSDTAESQSKVYSKPTTMKVACISDIHYPYEDRQATSIALSFLSDYKPDILVWNGDIFDFYAVSHYEKNPKKKMDIQEEIDYGFSEMEKWSKRLGPNTKHYFISGNHESRLQRMINKTAPALAHLRSTSIESNVNFKSINVEYVPDHQDLHIGDLMFVHGSVVRRHGGNSARGHYEQYGCSLIMGHTHRLAVLFKRNKYGTHTLIENGTLCDFDVEYVKYPDWQHGFTTIEFDGNSFVPTLRPIINHKLIADGKVYTA